MIREHAYYALCTILTFASTICFLWEPSGHPIHFIQPSLLVFLLRKTPQKETPQLHCESSLLFFFRSANPGGASFEKVAKVRRGDGENQFLDGCWTLQTRVFFVLKESVRLNLGYAPPKTNMDTQKWWFLLNMAIFWYLCQISGWYFLLANHFHLGLLLGSGRLVRIVWSSNVNLHE